jgi:MerR family transcriptional regulator, redox-sensitive transcriptional activator SoxR
MFVTKFKAKSMAEFTISEVARQVGVQASAIRYYEKIGLLPPARRVSGQRRYDSTMLYRLAVIQRARQLGFTLDEMRQLFFGVRSAARASERWQQLSRRKMAELDDLMDGIESVRRLLSRMMKNCRCETLEQCGMAIFRSGRIDLAGSVAASYRRRQ